MPVYHRESAYLMARCCSGPHNANFESDITGEALGDLGGVNLAYRAYLRSREGKGPEPTIDGFTPDQQFFLAEAQWRGAIVLAESLRTAVSADPHPPGRFRVLGPLSNMAEFEKAFNCKAGDPMVRPEAERCAVW